MGGAGDVYKRQLVLIPKDSATLQMRQVAVSQPLQGQHLGAKLVAFAESFAATQGFTRIVLNARQTAEAFYHKHGYTRVSEPFVCLLYTSSTLHPPFGYFIFVFFSPAWPL